MGAIRNQAHGPRRGIAPSYLFTTCLLAFGCNTPHSDAMDLRTNPSLYEATGYQAQVVVDRDAFIAPLVDERSPASITEASTQFPVRYIPDGAWSRPVLTMVEEIVVDELRDSGVFRTVRRSSPTADTLIVVPHVVAAHCGEEEQLAGRRSLAVVELRIVVYGPGESTEARPILFDRNVREAVASPVEMRPRRPMPLLGAALGKSMRGILAAIDQSNVSRSGVPIDPTISGQSR